MPHEHAGSSLPWVMPWNSEGLGNESVRRSVELASMPFSDARDGPDPQALREDLQYRRTGVLRRRRAIVALSLLGLTSMALVTLYQMGLVRHLPDPPFRRFHSDKVNASFSAYQYGVPDAMLSLATHTANIVMAGLGSGARARRTPWIPILAAGKAAADAGLAAKYLTLHMPLVERSWCGYAIIDALIRVGAFVLALPEAVEAVRYGVASPGSDGRVR